MESIVIELIVFVIIILILLITFYAIKSILPDTQDNKYTSLIFSIVTLLTAEVYTKKIEAAVGGIYALLKALKSILQILSIVLEILIYTLINFIFIILNIVIFILISIINLLGHLFNNIIKLTIIILNSFYNFIRKPQNIFFIFGISSNALFVSSALFENGIFIFMTEFLTNLNISNTYAVFTVNIIMGLIISLVETLLSYYIYENIEPKNRKSNGRFISIIIIAFLVFLADVIMQYKRSDLYNSSKLGPIKISLIATIFTVILPFAFGVLAYEYRVTSSYKLIGSNFEYFIKSKLELINKFFNNIITELNKLNFNLNVKIEIIFDNFDQVISYIIDELPKPLTFILLSKKYGQNLAKRKIKK